MNTNKYFITTNDCDIPVINDKLIWNLMDSLYNPQPNTSCTSLILLENLPYYTSFINSLIKLLYKLIDNLDYPQPQTEVNYYMPILNISKSKKGIIKLVNTNIKIVSKMIEPSIKPILCSSIITFIHYYYMGFPCCIILNEKHQLSKEFQKVLSHFDLQTLLRSNNINSNILVVFKGPRLKYFDFINITPYTFPPLSLNDILYAFKPLNITNIDFIPFKHVYGNKVIIKINPILFSKLFNKFSLILKFAIICAIYNTNSNRDLTNIYFDFFYLDNGKIETRRISKTISFYLTSIIFNYPDYEDNFIDYIKNTYMGHGYLKDQIITQINISIIYNV